MSTPLHHSPGALGQMPLNVAAVPVTFARGDGIGPEIMDATLAVLEAAGARLALEEIEVGEKVYQRGVTSGIDHSSWDSLRRTRVFLKAPITTPQGGGYKSLNVTTRKTLGLYANVRPCVSYSPFVPTLHPRMDVVVVRENEEDTYAGIEHRQTDEVYQCLKLHSRPGSEKIARYAFEYARAHGRKKVTCFTKDNIMKMTDGLFHRVFEEVAKEYPDIQNEHWIVDIGAAKLASHPENFDVVLLPNLYGDILSDVAAELTGSVGLGASANIGAACAMFEAIHGSAPKYAGQDVANPSGLLLASVMMLVHIGQPEIAQRVHNAWLKTIEDGLHTRDIHRDGSSREKVGTQAFAKAICARMGQEPKTLKPVRYEGGKAGFQVDVPETRPAKKELIGVDVFLHWTGAQRDPNELGRVLEPLVGGKFKLSMITNRGVKVWPGGYPETFCTDHWRCRFLGQGGLTHRDVVDLLGRVAGAGLDFIKTEHLCTFDGVKAYSLGQGE